MEVEEDMLTEIWNRFSSTARTFKRRLEIDLGQWNLKPIELKVLKLLSEMHEMPVNLIADKTEVTGPWITEIVNDLERKRYAKKTRNPADKRMIWVSITTEGQNALENGMQIFGSDVRRALRRLSPSDIKEFGRVLQEIESSL
ncbi:MAG: MarR family winged helix-turn-helix transcriptional regulator [Candidatus Thermoplasmatota archaeon]|jgi:MarR family 2-MHQ and catechol resistance regulon transcriptional repressor|nr:MarR family winged helix-turn-helix transcriptional regulator [Candidatus Thermoplasmatota archaeon]MCL5794073.1 MarR family winged helix-turn-helix transcriptional regulator [Candidatus Thermoplasmatota archaeon]